MKWYHVYLQHNIYIVLFRIADSLRIFDWIIRGKVQQPVYPWSLADGEDACCFCGCCTCRKRVGTSVLHMGRIKHASMTALLVGRPIGPLASYPRPSPAFGWFTHLCEGLSSCGPQRRSCSSKQVDQIWWTSVWCCRRRQ